MNHRTALALLFAALALPLSAATTRLAEDKRAFPNPERGFYFYHALAEADPFVKTLREERGITLLWGKITLTPWRETARLPDEFLARLQAGFDLAREAGLKVVVRAEYGDAGPDGRYTSYQDPKIEIIEGHIRQLAPLFARNADLIAFFEAGFVGPWGEWHGTPIANEPRLQRRVLLHLLENTPEDRMVLLRYPALKQSLFGSSRPLADHEAYDGSPRARTGHHNDCFLSSANDVGTYNRSGLRMADEQAYLAAETRHVFFGGETCALHDRSRRDTALRELEALHATYLNSGYHPDVLARWRDDGVMDELERRLGARLVVTALDLPEKGRAGERVRARLVVANRGFASLHNPRPAILVLIAPDGTRHRFPLPADPRRWMAGESAVVEADIPLPDGLAAGDYAWALHLPDASPRLAPDARYAYRLANEGAWDAKTGENRLVENWPVSR
jgi:hypothetical protein